MTETRVDDVVVTRVSPRDQRRRDFAVAGSFMGSEYCRDALDEVLPADGEPISRWHLTSFEDLEYAAEQDEVAKLYMGAYAFRELLQHEGGLYPQELLDLIERDCYGVINGWSIAGDWKEGLY